MLLRQDFCWNHEGRLLACQSRCDHGNRRHNRLPTPYVPLQETIHLVRRTQVKANLVHYFLLPIRQFKRQRLNKGLQRGIIIQHRLPFRLLVALLTHPLQAQLI